jgi:tetratricopeptide (TPR) repeat protein
MHLKLLSDRPVAADGQTDLLDRAAEAQRLADLVSASRSAAPFTLAVYADWGMGKSSLLLQMAERLKASGEVEVVWFNAWTADAGGSLEVLVKSVLDRLDPRSLRRLARAVSGDSAAASWSRVLVRGLAGTLRLDHLVDGIWERLAVDARTRNNAQELLRKALADWTGAGTARRTQRTIVVIVDDLDRCPPETIRAVSSAMKQYLNIPGLVFVLGCDRTVVEAAVADAGAGEGRRFLEKIIQAAYPIPDPTDAQVASLIEGYAQAAEAGQLFDGAVARALAEHAGRNPRRIKRLINRFVVEYQLDPEWAALGADALIRVVLLQDFYPGFHRLLARSADLDPIEEFDGYLAVVEADRKGVGQQPEQMERAERALREHGLPVPMSDLSLAESVIRLERELPEEFPALARDKTFVGLLADLGGMPGSARLRLKLRRSPKPGPGFATGAPGTSRDPSATPEESLAGMNILRLNSRATTSALDIDLDRSGARLKRVSTPREAVSALGAYPFVAIISNLHRDDREDGGFDDIRVIRTAGYHGPVIIYTSYVSPARRDQAAEVHAQITTDPAQVVSWLLDLRSGEQPAPQAVTQVSEAVEATVPPPRSEIDTASGNAASEIATLENTAASSTAAGNEEYTLLDRTARRYFEDGDLDRAEQRWDTAAMVARIAGDVAASLRAEAMKGRIALLKRRFPLAIDRFEYVLADEAWRSLEPGLIVQLYQDLANAYAAIGDAEHAANAASAAIALREPPEN